MKTPHVVIVGAGFGGLNVAKALRKAPVRVTVIDQNNFHLFQPLLYQVATAGLSPADIAVPIRSILRKQSNTEVLLDEVVGIDASKNLVLLNNRGIPYDYLVLATGSSYTYFGHDRWAMYTSGLKTISDATRIRRQILSAFEAAEQEASPDVRASMLRIAIVGGGPTGVELAGAIAELAYRAIAKDFRHIDPQETEIILIEAGPRILANLSPELSEAASKELKHLGVKVKTGARVQDIDPMGVTLQNERIETRTVIWAAGVVSSPAGKWLGAQMDRQGKVIVTKDLSVPGHPNVFVIGDCSHYEQDGKPLPGVAPVAMQMGKYVADVIRLRTQGSIDGDDTPAFHYWDKGNLATVGRRFAVADIGRFKLTGVTAWLTWLVVHVFYLIGFRNRVAVILQWIWMYVTFGRGARLIVPPEPHMQEPERVSRSA
ncbi:MAG: NAD(P)/FAD-dependent oxidoreductase [Bdellovibrionia bacterium]